MNRTNATKLILSSVLVALVALFIWMVTDGFNFPNMNAEAANLMAGNVVVGYDDSVFNITDVSIKYDNVWGPTMIGLIQNKDPFNTIEGVSLSVQMYDKNNHLIGVMKGYPQASYINPNQKTAFEIQSGDEDIRNIDHVFIEILATDCGSATANPSENVSTVGNYSSDRPYMGIVGLSLTPDLAKHIGLNQTKGFLLTSITRGSPAEKTGLRAGSTTITYNGTDIDIGGDIIVKIDNQSVSKIEDIMAYVSQKHPGDNVHLTILRDNIIREPDLILGQMPSQPISQNEGNKNQEELYNECVKVGGKSLCDFLFKRNDYAAGNTSKNSALEDYQNKYCPPMQLVKCTPPPGLEK
jgi:PDZ domain